MKWTAAAGVLSGVTYLARANLLHWSLVVGAVACVLAPGVPPRRRLLAFAGFCMGLMLVFGPQSYVFSTARGRFTFGETGKLGFADVYPAVWPGGVPAWPVVLEGGDVRLFTEPRDVQFPGFYDPSREFDDATIQFSLRRAAWAIPRSVNSCLMGAWSASFALMWPLLWAVWPLLLFGVGRFSGGSESRRQPSGIAMAAGVVADACRLRRRRHASPHLLQWLLPASVSHRVADGGMPGHAGRVAGRLECARSPARRPDSRHWIRRRRHVAHSAAYPDGRSQLRETNFPRPRPWPRR